MDQELKDLLEDRFDRLEEKVDATNGRVRSLEIWRAWTSGALKALGAVAVVPSLLLTIALLMER